MKIARLLIYSGDEASILAMLAPRAVRGFRAFPGVTISEYVYEGDVTSIELPPQTGELRKKLATLPEPPAGFHREKLTIKQAMVRADVSRRTIYTWITKGKVEYVRTAGGPVRVYADSLYKEASHGK